MTTMTFLGMISFALTSFLISLMLLVPIVKLESSDEQNDVSLKEPEIEEQSSDNQRDISLNGS